MSDEQQEWLDQAKSNRDVLKALLTAYHPRSSGKGHKPLTVSAPAAEAQRRTTVAALRAGPGPDPVVAFERALASGDTERIYHLLNEAWFGVPESRDCWQVTGFSEAVDLLENPPDWNPDDEAQP